MKEKHPYTSIHYHFSKEFVRYFMYVYVILARWITYQGQVYTLYRKFQAWSYRCSFDKTQDDPGICKSQWTYCPWGSAINFTYLGSVPEIGSSLHLEQLCPQTNRNLFIKQNKCLSCTPRETQTMVNV